MRMEFDSAPDSAMPIAAGPFSAWLVAMRETMENGSPSDVPCGSCTACCSSSYFIHIAPDETETLEKIGPDAVMQASGMPRGHRLMGHDAEGLCPQMNHGRCAVYAHRPRTCRAYDCRVFAAAGILESQDKPLINERVARWKFDYPTDRDQREHDAVRDAARFILDHANLFPRGRIPESPSQLATLALKVHPVFLDASTTPEETARRIVELSRAPKA
jgi:Fe-S-cluster containining protein